jgi:hypothetical protein
MRLNNNISTTIQKKSFLNCKQQNQNKHQNLSITQKI